MSDQCLRTLERRVNATRSREDLVRLDAALARVDGGPWLPAVRKDLLRLDTYESLRVDLLLDPIRMALLARTASAIGSRVAQAIERRVMGQIFGVATGPAFENNQYRWGSSWVTVDMAHPWVDPLAEARAAESFARANPRGVSSFHGVRNLLEELDRLTQPASPPPSEAPGPG